MGAVKAKGEEITKQRKGKVWTIKKLAKQSDCSERTIRSSEQSEHMQMFTIQKIAKALQVGAESLVDSPIQQPETKVRTWEVTIKISTSYDDFDEARDLSAFLATLMSRLEEKELFPIGVIRSSVSITFQAILETMTSLLKSYVTDGLDELPILTIKAPIDGYVSYTMSGSSDTLDELITCDDEGNYFYGDSETSSLEKETFSSLEKETFFEGNKDQWKRYIKG